MIHTRLDASQSATELDQPAFETFDLGEQDVLLTGMIDGAAVQAETTIELFDPGNSGGGPPNNKGQPNR